MITRRNLFVENDIVNNRKNAFPLHEENNEINNLKTNKSQLNGSLEQQSNGLYYHHNYDNQANGYTKNNETYKKSGAAQCQQQVRYSYSDHTKESYESIPFYIPIVSYIGYYILMILGFINQVFFTPKVASERDREGYAPLFNVAECFYMRYIYRRIRDCFNRPICSVPAAEITLKDRITNDYCWTFEFTGTQTTYLNLGSYNYLGFAANSGPCVENSVKTIETYNLAACSPRGEYGTSSLHLELEKLTAQFLGVEDAIVFGMGFATNSLNLPSLLSPGCLVVSDEKNHASIILGLRLSGATVRLFKHNDTLDLEMVLQNGICSGQPNGKPWKKIVIVVEGVFSMEGSVCKLPEIIALKKKYKTYVYLDEAHSVGAMGPNGRGITDYFDIDPNDVDILMGTFTKSFGSSGGYIAGSKDLVNFLRVNSHAHCYASSMSPPVAQQILSSMKIIMGLDGTTNGKHRIDQLARNTRYFRRKLVQMGVILYGHEDSPVVPLLVYYFAKVGAVVRYFAEKKLAVVGVGFPATPMLESRIRFCLSAAHTKEHLDHALSIIREASDFLGLKYSRKPIIPENIEY